MISQFCRGNLWKFKDLVALCGQKRLKLTDNELRINDKNRKKLHDEFDRSRVRFGEDS